MSLISIGQHRDEMNDEQIHVIIVQITNFLYFSR